MTARHNLNFHQTFAPEREHLSRLIRLAEDDMQPMTKEEIFKKVGIPTGKKSGKVEPHIAYAVHMGLVESNPIEKKYKLTRTDLGEIVYENDPHLIEPLTLLVCHYNLSSSHSGATLWQYIFQKVVAGLGREFHQETLTNAASVEFSGLQIKLSPFRSCYTTDKSFGSLNLLSVSPEKIWQFNSISYQSDFRYLYAYTLLRTWENTLPARKEITSDEIIETLRWNAPYVWNDKETLSILEGLSDLTLISLNKQLSPITIIRRTTSHHVLEKMYSSLL